MKKGDEVVINRRIKTYSSKIAPGQRAVVAQIPQGDEWSRSFVLIQIRGKDYRTTVPDFTLDPVTVLDKLAEI